MTATATLAPLVDPTGRRNKAADSTLAPRPTSLRGLTVGLLDNTKPNATALLTAIAGELRQRYDVAEPRSYVKDYFGTPAEPELIERIVRECDVVITAIGDCGSCSAATVADGVLFERAGLPAVSICSDSFLMSARAMAGLEGFPGFEFIAVQHPVASLDGEQIAQRARGAMPEVLRILGVEA
ncbi:UGSC family (seleno)protein [Geodermatophilus sabuli]|uniref:UGSC-like domain-containing protein n=1 Tax=Geodermatophilus sabuli TaxID=1564158 RepID=A0A285EIS0_9ACTN|nr:UGSC family (seleno)protein [Geodermatophilus sabuli]MBB3082927.1 hypothetical protein [Geodermatophilus sabuli]SNX97926.1 hypothetical protein SAMN06893097_1096 [Geodermatophilus sabuli]